MSQLVSFCAGCRRRHHRFFQQIGVKFSTDEKETEAAKCSFMQLSVQNQTHDFD